MDLTISRHNIDIHILKHLDTWSTKKLIITYVHDFVINNDCIIHTTQSNFQIFYIFIINRRIILKFRYIMIWFIKIGISLIIVYLYSLLTYSFQHCLAIKILGITYCFIKNQFMYYFLKILQNSIIVDLLLIFGCSTLSFYFLKALEIFSLIYTQHNYCT